MPRHANRSVIRLTLIGILLGFAIGFLSAIGQYALPNSIEQIANSGAMWVIIAFVMGRPHYSRRHSREPSRCSRSWLAFMRLPGGCISR
jgi:hypothetical protein